MGITIFSGLQGEAAFVGGQHFPYEDETKSSANQTSSSSPSTSTLPATAPNG